MDPTMTLTKYKNYQDPSDNNTNKFKLHTYTHSLDATAGNKINYYDPTKQKNQQKNQQKIPKELSDPFHDISPDPFMNKDAMVLCNLDMVFNFSKHTSGYILKQESVKDISFGVIDDGPGGFAQYLMYRNPSSYGYGYGLSDNNLENNPEKKSNSKNYDKTKLDMTHFNIIVSKNKFNDHIKFIRDVKTVEALGLNIIAGNYISDNDINPMGYIFRLMISLATLEIKGTFLTKVKNITDNMMIDLFYITSQCFDKITLFKPISTPSDDGIYYVICEDSKINNLEWFTYLEKIYSDYLESHQVPTRLIDNNQIPNELKNWVYEYDNLMKSYNNYLINIFNNNNKNKNNKIEIYDTYKAKATWNYP